MGRGWFVGTVVLLFICTFAATTNMQSILSAFSKLSDSLKALRTLNDTSKARKTTQERDDFGLADTSQRRRRLGITPQDIELGIS